MDQHGQKLQEEGISFAQDTKSFEPGAVVDYVQPRRSSRSMKAYLQEILEDDLVRVFVAPIRLI